MKLLTIAVPCYNSENYMRHCIDSLLKGGDEVEILIVDDGSTKDATPQIADEYAAKYPTIIRVIHQENKGHGGAVNTGIENAKGLYFKVVDSDDWVDEGAYKKILHALERIVRGPDTVDVVFSNYVYEKEGSEKKRVMRYIKSFPQDMVFGWDTMKPLGPAHYVLMHSLIFRTGLLKECGLELPEHTFYVDNIYAFEPFPYVRKMYYVNTNFYRYYIGRPDQSVQEDVMIRRIDQQINVNNMMIDYLSDYKLSGNMKRYMTHSLSIIMIVTSMMLIRIDTPDALNKKDELWKRLKVKCPGIYNEIRYSTMGRAMHAWGKGGRKLVETGYKIVSKVYGFN